MSDGDATKEKTEAQLDTSCATEASQESKEVPSGLGGQAVAISVTV